MAEMLPRLQELSPAERRALMAKVIARRNAAGKVAPLSYAQRRLWFLEQLVAGNPYYNETSALRFRFAVDADALRLGLNEIVSRHEALRTVFEAGDGEPRQRVLPQLELEMPVFDLSGMAPEQREVEALREVREQGLRAFDLASGPLLRGCLIRCGPDDFIFGLTMHHIVCDGWSMKIFFEELRAFYEAKVTGIRAALPPLKVQYPDFAVWQREWLSGPVLERQLSYWKDQLADLPQLELPADLPRPAVPAFRGGVERIRISPEVCGALRRLCEQERATLFMALLAVYQVLLHRYSGQDNIVVGSPIANRNRPELEKLIGFFINTLVMRTDLSGNPSFREALRRVREMSLSAYAHQDVPFETLVEELHPKRDPSHHPLFQVTFQLLSAPASGYESEGALLQALDVEMHTAKFDLQCDLWETPAGGVEGYYAYSTDLFLAETVRAMARHFETLAESASCSPHLRIGALPMLTAAEIGELLRRSSGEPADFRDFGCVHEAFERQAEQHETAIAVSGPEHSLSYGELNRQANRLARYLKTRGVLPGSLVAVLMDRSVEYVLAILAVAKAGAAYVPLDPAYPEERLALMLKDSLAQLVLTTSGRAAKAPAYVPQIRVDEDAALWAGQSGANLPRQIDSRSLAYVVFTSGSTGLPKGVEVLHGGLANLVCWHNREYGVTPADRATLYASPAFDASVWETWPYLAAGASLWIPDERTHASPEELLAWMAGAGITIGFLPTPIAESVVDLAMPPGLRLRALLTGGDKLHRYPSRPLPFRLVNHYGPTENTVVATFVDVSEGPAEGVPPIGRPIANVQALVLDRFLRPVPVGAKGVLYLAGRSLARGYLNDAAQSKGPFLPNPFDRRPGSVMYRTGDIVRYRRDGNLEFHGRADRQVKVRGFRIEPGDIEAALNRHSLVRACLVASRQMPSGDTVLVAYVVPAQGQPGSPEEMQEIAEQLRNHLRGKLPEYMVPGQYVCMERLPLTANGKINRGALPAPPQLGQFAGARYVAPRGTLEQRIASIWSQLLGVERISADANFFDLGGHSLLLIRLHNKLKQAFRTELSVIDLFRYPTVRAIARAITA